MKYDAIVISSGQAGNPLCYALAERGWTVALIKKSNLGGTCINTGCTPTKTMVASAQVAHYAPRDEVGREYRRSYGRPPGGCPAEQCRGPEFSERSPKPRTRNSYDASKSHDPHN